MAKVLVVDDDPDIRAVIMEALGAAGHEVSSATNGREGVQHALAIQPDLVITDLFMPEQEGLETIRKLNQQIPHVAILAISGRSVASSSMLTIALELGAVNVLEKPFDTLTLRAAVEATLETRAHSKSPDRHQCPSTALRRAGLGKSHIAGEIIDTDHNEFPGERNIPR